MDSQLRQISQLVQEKRYDDARAPLQKYLRDNPDTAYAWYLLSFVVVKPAEKQKAIRKAVQLAPDDPKYATRLTKLGASKKRSPVLPLVILGVILIAIVAIAFAALRPADTPPTDLLPTVIAQDAIATQESLQIAAAASATGIAESTTAEILSADTTQTAAPETTETLADGSTTAEATPTEAIDSVTINQTVEATTLPLLTAPTAQSVVPLPTTVSANNGTPQPTVFVPAAPSSTPTTVTTPLPGVPTVTPGGDAGVALSTPLNIGAGEMRIVAAVRPATSLITELGGAAANPPAGQQWLLIEALVICSGRDNCSPALSDIRVVGSSGTTYAPALDFSMPQLFGPSAFAVSQVWGYMGFSIPTSETTLRLVLNQNGTTYTFALQ